MASLHKYRDPFIRTGISLLVIIFSHMPSSGLGQIYKWTDENGRTHYGDKPERDNAVRMETAGTPAPDPGLSERQRQQRHLLETLESTRHKQQQLKADEKASEQRRQANCETATNRLSQMKNSSYVYEKTADPDNPRILTVDEYNTTLVSAERDVQIWCTKSGK